jgi:hypothetical protein
MRLQIPKRRVIAPSAFFSPRSQAWQPGRREENEQATVIHSISINFHRQIQRSADWK